MLANINVSAGYYSLPDVAQAISTPSEKFTCDPSLRNRIALIRITNQPLAVVEAHIGRMFGVKFVAKGDVETIVPDPARQREERTLKSAFVDAFASPFSTAWSRANELLPQINPQSLTAATPGLQKIVDEKGDDTAAANLLIQIGNGKIDTLTYGWLARGPDFASLLQDDLIEVGNESDLESVVSVTTGAPSTVLGAVKQSLIDSHLNRDQQDELLGKIGAELTYVHRVDFDPVSGHVLSDESINFRPNAGTGGMGFTSFVPDQIRIPNPGIAGTYVAANFASYTERRKRTVDFLSKKGAQASFQMSASSRSVAEAVLAWAVNENRDVVMEVSFCRDLSPNSPTKSTSLADEIPNGTPRTRPVQAPGDFDLRPDAVMVSQRLEQQRRESSYSIDEEDGIVDVRDEYAFIDHQFAFPGSCIAAYEAKTEASPDHLPSLEALEAFAKTATSKENGLLARFDCSLIPAQVTTSYPFLRLLLKSGRLAKALSEKTVEQVGYPASEFQSADIRKFATDLADLSKANLRAFKDQPIADAICANPHLADYLQAGTIAISHSQRPNGIRLNFFIYLPQKYVIPVLRNSEYTYDPPTPNSMVLLPPITLDVKSP